MAVWDLMRLSDYLLALSESNGFLACAGMSGGGQQTVWFSAMDDRVKAAITSGYFYGFKESLIELPKIVLVILFHICLKQQIWVN